MFVSGFARNKVLSENSIENQNVAGDILIFNAGFKRNIIASDDISFPLFAELCIAK